MNDGSPRPVPPALEAGVPMLKISSKKIKQVIIRLQNGVISWSSKTDSKVPISAIRELRLGQPPSSAYSSTRWITVVYVRQTQWKVLHMIALTDAMYTCWVDTLKHLVADTVDRLVESGDGGGGGQMSPTDPDAVWIRQLWPAGQRELEVERAVGLCRGIGLVVPTEVMARYKGPLDYAAFRQLIKDAQTRPDIATLHQELCKGGPLDRAKVETFLHDVQDIDPLDIFETYAQSEGAWSADALASFLGSMDNTPTRSMDMTKPLHDYFISSSHNTYLVGEQWRGESTIEGYIRVLLAKCRCVEMDCHDGETEPDVFHKGTLTTPVSFRDICAAINRYAFVTSPYPVILNTEVHCSTEQQARLAQILRETFGDKLITSPLNESKLELPSPDQLKHRILFKAKPPPPPEAKSPKSELSAHTDSTSSTESDSSFARLTRRLSIQGNSKPAFSPNLFDLLVYTEGTKYKGFSKLVEYESNQQFSVSDRTAMRIIKEDRAAWVKHNFNHLSRVYPRGVKLGSSNYDPCPMWAAGCQIVALNWQTVDEGFVMNHAMFVESQGYVLKPLALRAKTQETPHSFRVKLQIISAQRLPLSPDLHVEAFIHTPTFETPIRRTRSTKGITVNPQWDESIEFILQDIPASTLELAYLHIQIISSRHDLVAQWVRPVSAAPRGYHHLTLYDKLCSKFVFASLFVRIGVEELL